MKRALAVAMLLLVICVALFAADLMRPFRGYTGSVIIDIPPGTQAPGVANTLAAKGVLAHRLPFLLLYALRRQHHRLQAGEYLFDRPLRPIDVYRKLVRGEVYFSTVVVPEGSNCFDIARIVHDKLGIAPDDFLRLTRDTSSIRDLDPRAPSLEGYLFPDTYRLAHHTSAAGVIAAMEARFRQVLRQNFRQDFTMQGAGLHDALTLASLVEKETPDPNERPIVAQVFKLRLQEGMPLQCDPTVLYAAQLDHRPIGPITAADLGSQSSYNTYVHTGLPPGPICNSGVASIRAALHPASTHYLYFVSNNHGGHIFATTLADHQRNVARYRHDRRAMPKLTGRSRRSSLSKEFQSGGM